MDRRAFFKMLGSAAAVTAAGLLVPPDLLELLAPEKTIILPPAGGWVARPRNTLLTMSMLTNEALVMLRSNLTLGQAAARWVEPDMSDTQLLREVRPGERLLPGKVQFWKRS